MQVTKEMYDNYINKNSDKLRVKTYTNEKTNLSITEHYENVKLGQKTAECINDNGKLEYRLFMFRCG